MAVKSKSLPFVLLGLIAAAAGIATLSWRQQVHAPPSLSTGMVMEPRRPIPQFNLIDHQGRPFVRANLLGHWSMLYFGYTNCPDLCPTTLSTLAGMHKRMHAAGDPLIPQVIFVSADPARDTPAQLAKFVPYFDPEFLGVTASSQAAVEAFATPLGIEIAITPKPDGSYTVDHSSAILVIDPRAQVAAILTGSYTPAALQTDFQRIIGDRS